MDYYGISRRETIRLRILTDTISIRYPGRKLLRLIILCSKSFVGSESSVTSTLSNAQMLSKGGFSNCNNKQSIVGWNPLLEFVDQQIEHFIKKL